MYSACAALIFMALCGLQKHATLESPSQQYSREQD